MAKKQGKVKAIPVKEVTEGMQVIDRFNNICKVISNSSLQATYFMVEVICRDGVKRIHEEYFDDAKTLVVEYEKPGYEDWMGDDYTGEPVWIDGEIKQLSLKYSQWQSAIDNGEVDSDKIVEFEYDYPRASKTKEGVEIAKIRNIL